MRFLLTLLIFQFFTLNATEERQAIFTPPEGWRIADAKILPKLVKFMAVGKGSHAVPPSMNLGFEPYSGTLKDYLKIIKDINASQGDVWKDLGTITTESGPASLSLVDVKTEWGIIRQMHLIYLDQGIIYILTAAALSDEFPKFYNEFYRAFASFHIKK